MARTTRTSSSTPQLQNFAISGLLPRLRFPEFAGRPGWTRKTVEQLSATITPPKKLQTPEYQPSGAFPIIDQSQAAIAGWTNDGYAVIRAPLPLVIFGDHTCVLKLAREPFAQGADGVKILQPSEEITAEFLFCSLTHRPLAMEEYKRHFALLKVRPVDYPALDSGEQQRISACLTSLDEAIAAQGRKVEALKAHKKGLMQHLFPQEGQTLPRLRFPEFRDGPEWTEKPAGEFFSSRKEDGEEGLPIYSVTVNDGMVPRASFDRDFYDIEDAAGNKKALRGDIVYNMMRMWQGAEGVAPESCLVSPAYVVLAPKPGVRAEFFAHLFKLPQSLRLLTAHSRGLTKDRLRLYFDDFARMPLRAPGPAEQQRIADCVASLDAAITAAFAALTALKTHKAGLMQGLFPDSEH